MSVWRVLLVDDSALIRNAMQTALEPYGLDLVHAENGAVAVDKAMSSNWDLIFLDVVMPVKDGPTALREIRARGNGAPVVLVTSVSTASVVASAVKLGGVTYIAKPFTPQQIRSVASKLLRLDSDLSAAAPRILLQHTSPTLPERLRKLLPAHIAIESSHALAQTVDLIEETRRDLVLFETGEPLDEMVAIANVIRRTLPAAGIFAINDAAEAAAPWCPDEGLDGVLPSALDDGLTRGFLYPNFLRPLVRVEGGVAHVAGFRGAPSHLPAYLASLSRALIEHCTGVDQTADLQIDLTRAPYDADALVTVVTGVDRDLRAAGAAPVFQLGAAMQAATGERLGEAILLAERA